MRPRPVIGSYAAAMRPFSPPRVVREWLRFTAVGATNTLLSWCVYAVLEAVGVQYLLASGVAFLLGALNSFALNRRWTFGSHAPRLPEALRFGLVQGTGLGIDIALMYLLVDVIGVHHLVAQALTFPPASMVTFLLSRHWVFARGR